MTLNARSLKNSNLYLVLDAEVHPYSKLLRIAQESISSGVDIVQLRDKKGTKKDILSFSKKLHKLIGDRALYIINDNVDLSVEANASGVHLGQEDDTIELARKRLRKDAIIGVSCQDLDKAQEAQDKGADYIGFGSVFKTLTKPNRAPMDLGLLSAVIKKIKIPVFAIGGIKENNIPLLRSLGVERVAVCRAICNAYNVSQATKAIREALVR